MSGPVIPGPTGWQALRTLMQLRTDPIGCLLQLSRRYGDIIQYRYGSMSRVLINHPAGVARVLLDNSKNYDKKSPFYAMLGWFLGKGLITSDGDLWQKQRRLIQPAFTRKRVEELEPMMVSTTEAMIESWKGHPVVDIGREMTTLTLRIIGQTLFSQDLSQRTHQLGSIMQELQQQMERRFRSYFPLPPVLPTSRDRHFRTITSLSRQILSDMVDSRRTLKDPPQDVLQVLLEARDPETGEAMPPEQLGDELVNLVMAGHETVATHLSWTLLLLSRHPDVRRRLENEEPGLAGRVVLESLRLYPPVSVFGRRCLAGDEICGYPIAAGQLVSISPYLLHRHPEFWPNPEGFEPDRFLHERVRGSFVPFAAGPRNCLGQFLALREAELVLTTLVRSVRLNLLPGQIELIHPEAQITLRPSQGPWMQLEWR